MFYTFFTSNAGNSWRCLSDPDGGLVREHKWDFRNALQNISTYYLQLKHTLGAPIANN